MGDASRAFRQQQRQLGTNDNGRTVIEADLPWRLASDGQLPPMMFEVRLCDGTSESFPYGDIRRIRCRDAGHIQLETFSSPRTVVTFEGRHLRELATMLAIARVMWIAETDSRDVDRSEELPAITRIRIELTPRE